MQLIRGRNLSFFEKPSEMVMFGTTQDEPMFTLAFHWQRHTGPNGEASNEALLRNGGRWVRAMVDGSAKTWMWGRYRTNAYRHLGMPKNRRDIEMMCSSLDAPGGSGRTCEQWIEFFLSQRQAF